ncbi:hypothetical protein BO94DRAFT_583624 [Aspergillus sclerotioniger CBS 115572]|uniref:Uncharacterized protein n=1 Tax=Aspergillus sclerotioniger CBS 115572 TaxID=1450535 RepID=A0A317X562_9EURO|nr:hypothetical protein BO94DRAFT_583624 [Aspergillus sclerotioniger CBS 115572]PWY91690.1 hypothetical protein BO94DRAFT_583624 [Aspergillus sclerotioniger CBS 115572]
MRWTLENEHVLWRTIFETQNLTLDLDKIAEAWPGDDMPTARAIKEHLEKFRRGLKSGNSVTFSMGGKRAADDDSSGAVATPRKKRATKKKVKQEQDEEGENDDDFTPFGGKVEE